MQLGGIFDNNYEMSLFTGFNVNNLSNAYRNNRSRTQLMAKYGPINITSDMCTVSNVVTTETNMAISLRITEEFNQFLQMLENTVYRMYYRDQVTKKVSCDNESLIITVDIPEYKIANQVKYGNSILISHRGSGLNLEEDLRTGDTVQFSFRVYLINLHNERSLSIDIFKLIKYTNTQVEDIQVPHEDPELTEYTGKIDYAM
jgi:hypothetical protein